MSFSQAVRSSVVFLSLSASLAFGGSTQMINASCEDAIARSTLLAAHRKRASVRPYPTAPALNVESNRNYAKQVLLPFGQVWSHRKFGALGFTATGDDCSVTSNGHPADVVLSDLGKAFDHSTLGMSTAPAGLSASHVGAGILSTELSAAPAVSRTSMPIPALGLTVATWNEGGARIIGIAPGGAAELAQLHVGDVINAVDRKPVNSAPELAAVFGSTARGAKVRVGYLYHTAAVGNIQKEADMITQ